MKRIFFASLFALATLAAAAQELTYTHASDLTVLGQVDPVQEPYQRVDLSLYPALTATEAALLRQPAGMAVVFRTDSPVIGVRTFYQKRYSGMTNNQVAGAGFDLHIRRDGEWLYAGSQAEATEGKALVLVRDMDSSMKECLLYLPLFSEVGIVEIATAAGSTIEQIENPLRHRIAIFGSSFTHGACASRAGMTYPAQMSRNTGLYFINLGVSGNSKLQPAFADILIASNADAFVLDAFSNPTPEEIETRLLPFIARVRKSCPKTPMIFVGTIYRESDNFDLKKRAFFADRMVRARSMMEKAMDKYNDVYFLDIPDLTGVDHLTSVDGTHPSDLGYYRWANRLQSPLLEVLAKYGIK